MDLGAANNQISGLAKKSTYLKLLRVVENQALSKQTRFEAATSLIEKAMSEDNLE